MTGNQLSPPLVLVEFGPFVYGRKYSPSIRAHAYDRPETSLRLVEAIVEPNKVSNDKASSLPGGGHAALDTGPSGPRVAAPVFRGGYRILPNG